MAVGVGVVAIVGVAIVTLGVAALVLFLDFGQRVHRAFALFLVLRAMMDGMLFFSLDDGLGYRLRMYWLIAVPFAALHFCLAYRRRHGSAPRSRPAWLAPLSILVVALAFEALYLFDHDLYAGPPDVGPLASFESIRFLAYAGVAWVFAAEYRGTRSAIGRRALLLASVGFALTPLYFCTTQLGYLALNDDLSWSPGVVYFVLSLALLGDSCVRLVRHSRGRTRTSVAAIFAAGLLASASSLAVWAFMEGAFEHVLQSLVAMSALAVPLCITYALVKHRLFDAEVKLRFAIKGTTVTGAFLAVFIVVQQLIQAVSNEIFGAIGGAIATGLLLFALSPLQRWADRVSHRAVPGVGKRGSHAERLQIYREQLEIAWADGQLTAKERLLFSRLQARLGIPADEAGRVERSVVESLAAPRRHRFAPA